jgi:ceramide glucosyltransferase
MDWVLQVVFAVALGYQLAAMAAGLRYASANRQRKRYRPGVSVLKPVHGRDEALEGALRSHLTQQYEEFEVLVGVSSWDDEAVPVVQRLLAEHPEAQARIVLCPTVAPNAKAGKLVDLEREARYDVLLVNDSDITVPRDYLERVVEPLGDAGIGLVTCPYRADAGSVAGFWEAFGIATDFMPSTMVAPMVGIKEFGLGSTLCFRRADLQAIGGFAAVSEYIADDYQLAKRITQTGKRAYMSEVVVDTHLNSPTWGQVWRHQVRWGRTIRVSRGDGYLGLPVTHAGVWTLALAAAGRLDLAVALWLARTAMAAATCLGWLRWWPGVWLSPLAAVWDLFAFAVWTVALRGSEVVWRSGKMRLSDDGRIVEKIQ